MAISNMLKSKDRPEFQTQLHYPLQFLALGKFFSPASPASLQNGDERRTLQGHHEIVLVTLERSASHIVGGTYYE